jgi:hypothetical protein
MWPELADDTGAVIEVLDQLWGSVMTELGIDYISPRTLWHDFFEPESMTCGGLPAGVAWACVENADALIGREEAGEVIPFSEVDLTVNFDARVFLSALEGVDSPPEVGLPEGLKDAGDMIIWLVLAHEWGHAVQWHFELQGLPRLSSVDKARELQADCMSGGALGDGIRQELLIEEPGDQDEASASLYLVRDGLEANGGDPHGSALERQSAFIDGWEDGLAACLFVPFTDVTPDVTPDDLAG